MGLPGIECFCLPEWKLIIMTVPLEMVLKFWSLNTVFIMSHYICIPLIIAKSMSEVNISCSQTASEGRWSLLEGITDSFFLEAPSGSHDQWATEEIV